MNNTPNINGMGAFETLQSATLMRQKLVRNARLSLADLCAADFEMVVVAAILQRPAMITRIGRQIEPLK